MARRLAICGGIDMKIRFFNAKILTMEAGKEIFDGEVWIEDTKILYVGTGEDKEAFFKRTGITCMIWDEEIDCEGNLLMPGFKDAHTHSGMTLLRSLADDLPLQEWLNGQIFPTEAKLRKEDIYEASRLAVLEYLTSGITSIFDMYLAPEETGRACEEMGMRCVQVSGLNNFTQSPEFMEKMYLTYNQNKEDSLLSYQMGFHAEYTCSKDLLLQAADLAHKYKAPVFMHLSETEAEVLACRERYGMSPVQFLDAIGMFEYGGGGYHCVHLSEEDMDIFEKKKLYVITNPASNLKLASGIAPVTALLERGIKVAIGTDGAASNNCLDLFREMFLVSGLAKIREKDAAVVDATEVLKMACVNGAGAMQLTDCDGLLAGKKADLIMIDLQLPNMQPLNHIAKNIVYSGSKQNVKMTMINGKILYRDGKFFVGVKPEEIYQRVNSIMQRIKKERNEKVSLGEN